jgi:hypothetical protein
LIELTSFQFTKSQIKEGQKAIAIAEKETEARKLLNERYISEPRKGIRHK